MAEAKLGRVRSNSGCGGLTSQLTSSSFGRDVKIGVPCLDAAYTVGLKKHSEGRNPDKPIQNKLKTNKQTKIMVLTRGKERLIARPNKDMHKNRA